MGRAWATVTTAAGTAALAAWAGGAGAQEAAPADPLAGLRVEACVFGGGLELVTLAQVADGWRAFHPWTDATVTEGEGGSLTLVGEGDVLQLAGPNSTAIRSGVPETGACETVTAELEVAARVLLDQLLAENPEAAVDELRREQAEELATMRDRVTAAEAAAASAQATARAEAQAALDEGRAQFEDDRAGLTAALAMVRARNAILGTEVNNLEAELGARADTLEPLSQCRVVARQAASNALLNIERLANGRVPPDDVPAVAGLVGSELARVREACPAPGM